MKIIVSVKQVPAKDSALAVEAGGKWLNESALTYEMNEPDAYALEEALQLREKLGGEVVVLSLGPDRVTTTIRDALAKGADRAIHVQIDESGSLDPLAAARLMAKAVAAEGAELILTGLQSDDLGYGQTGVVLAELLGFAHATIVMEVEVTDAAVRVKRELEDGWYQHVTLPLPAVLTIQSGIKRLRYATLMGIKKAKTKEVKTITAASLGVERATGFSIQDLQSPQRTKESKLFTGQTKEAVTQLVDALRFEARVL